MHWTDTISFSNVLLRVRNKVNVFKSISWILFTDRVQLSNRGSWRTVKFLLGAICSLLLSIVCWIYIVYYMRFNFRLSTYVYKTSFRHQSAVISHCRLYIGRQWDYSRRGSHGNKVYWLVVIRNYISHRKANILCMHDMSCLYQMNIMFYNKCCKSFYLWCIQCCIHTVSLKVFHARIFSTLIVM